MTDDELLNLARGEAGWAELHEVCLERPTAERLARALEKEAPRMAYEAAIWASVLQEMHAGLRVVLPVRRTG